MVDGINANDCLKCKHREKCRNHCMGFEFEKEVPKINKEMLLDYISNDAYKLNVDKVNPDNSVSITLIPKKDLMVRYTSNKITDEIVNMLVDKYSKYGIKNQDIIRNMRQIIYIEVNHLVDMVGNHENN
ncbi:MAG: hypothetical protein IJ842_01315 [Bacilli bacterium]|nr:hypothetical protein [Bacilli bacterium]